MKLKERRESWRALYQHCSVSPSGRQAGCAARSVESQSAIDGVNDGAERVYSRL